LRVTAEALAKMPQIAGLAARAPGEAQQHVRQQKVEQERVEKAHHWAMGNGQWAMVNGQLEMGNGKWEMETTARYTLANSHSLFPISYSPFHHSPFTIHRFL
jgi:hypothetical protein